MIYQIKDWRTHFENNKSRERDQCSFVCVRNKQHGMGLIRVLAEPDGAAIIGIWVLILQACSRQKRHRDGWLTDDGHSTGTAWTVADLALRWRRPEVEVERTLNFLSSPQVGWIQAHTEVPAECPASALEEKRIEKNSPDGGGAAPAPDSGSVEREAQAPANGKQALRTIWDLGVNMLCETGMSAKSARAIFGKLTKDYGNTAVAQAVAMTSSANAAEPHTYLIKLLQPKDGKHGKPYDGIQGGSGGNTSQTGSGGNRRETRAEHIERVYAEQDDAALFGAPRRGSG